MVNAVGVVVGGQSDEMFLGLLALFGTTPLNSPLVGSFAKAFTIALAWAMLARPAPSAALMAGCASRALLNLRSERAAMRVCWVSTATRSRCGCDGPPVVAPERSASPRPRNRERRELGFGLGQVGEGGAMPSGASSSS